MSLEDRSPVTKEKNKESKDRPVLGRGQVNKVKVEIIEEKPKYPPYVLSEDTLGHDTYHAQRTNSKRRKPRCLSLRNNNKTKNRNVQAETIQDKGSRRDHLVGLGPSSPGTKSADPERSGPLTWSDADITMAYHRRNLDTFLTTR